jgi:putative endonuclease
MFFVYILRSEASGKLYTGYTTDLDHRLGQHNHGITKSTKDRGPWIVVHTEEFSTRAEAMRREKYLKSGHGREQLREILARKTSSAG